MNTNLIRAFDGARLTLVMPGAPLVREAAEIFQMDIRRERNLEWFRLWPGHETNSVQVADSDRARRQLVLLVKETRRSFVEKVSKRWVDRERAERRAQEAGGRVIRETPYDIWIERWTPESLRRYLCGRDEAHLFVAQVEGGTTVADAHRRLKPQAVQEAERSGAGGILRQGEWFFLPLTEGESVQMAQRLKAAPWRIRRNGSLGGNGRPHLAAELVRDGPDKVFARGAIRHPDHKTLVLTEWRRVQRNAEVRQSSVGSNGIYWID
jgi:hypothetical protein